MIRLVDYIKECLKNPEFREVWNKICDDDLNLNANDIEDNSKIAIIDNLSSSQGKKVEMASDRHGKPISYERHRYCIVGAAVDDCGNPFLKKKEYTKTREKCPFCGTTLLGEWNCYCDKCGAKMDKES